MNEIPTYETKKQFAKRHGISLRTLDHWLSSGKIPYRRMSQRCIRIPTERAEAALQRFDVNPVGR